MKLRATPLIDCQNVNDFTYATEVSSTTGDPVDLYFQLSNAEKNISTQGYNPSGLRYMPVAGSNLKVTFQNINNCKEFTRYATQPFSQDPSIFKVQVLASDPVAGTVSMKFVLNEPSGTGTITKTCYLQANFLCDRPMPYVGNPRPF
jgi:hypothetical protein